MFPHGNNSRAHSHCISAISLLQWEDQHSSCYFAPCSFTLQYKKCIICLTFSRACNILMLALFPYHKVLFLLLLNLFSFDIKKKSMHVHLNYDPSVKVFLPVLQKTCIYCCMECSYQCTKTASHLVIKIIY